MKKIPRFIARTPIFLTKKDTRYKHYVTQLKKTGISDTELWNLDYTIACFILPRLKLFRSNMFGYPVISECYYSNDVNFSNKTCSNNNRKLWKKYLDKMIYSFNKITTDYSYNNDRINKKIQEGLDLFAKYFSSLWQ